MFHRLRIRVHRLGYTCHGKSCPNARTQRLYVGYVIHSLTHTHASYLVYIDASIHIHKLARNVRRDRLSSIERIEPVYIWFNRIEYFEQNNQNSHSRFVDEWRTTSEINRIEGEEPSNCRMGERLCSVGYFCALVCAMRMKYSMKIFSFFQSKFTVTFEPTPSEPFDENNEVTMRARSLASQRSPTFT